MDFISFKSNSYDRKAELKSDFRMKAGNLQLTGIVLSSAGDTEIQEQCLSAQLFTWSCRLR